MKAAGRLGGPLIGSLPNLKNLMCAVESILQDGTIYDFRFIPGFYGRAGIHPLGGSDLAGKQLK